MSFYRWSNRNRFRSAVWSSEVPCGVTAAAGVGVVGCAMTAGREERGIVVGRTVRGTRPWPAPYSRGVGVTGRAIGVWLIAGCVCGVATCVVELKRSLSKGRCDLIEDAVSGSFFCGEATSSVSTTGTGVAGLIFAPTLDRD